MPTVPRRERPLLRCGCLLIRRWLRHNGAVQSAALAFYLLFTAFPLMIFVSALLGSLRLDVAGILRDLEFLPREVVALAEMYLRYVSENSSPRLLLFGLVFSVYFPMRATYSLMGSVRTAYHLGPPENMLIHRLKALACTVLLIGAITLTLVLMTVGERLLMLAVEKAGLPAFAAQLWVRLRFPVAAMAGLFVLLSLYALAQDRHRPGRELWPGAAAALGAWLLLSWLYAFYVDHIAGYTTLYGSVGAVIVLLVWLNLSAAVLILGAEWNGVLMALRKEQRADG